MYFLQNAVLVMSAWTWGNSRSLNENSDADRAGGAQAWGDVQVVRTGATRIVFLVGTYAVKIPNVCNGWKLFLLGLLANMQEATFSSMGWRTLCPVLWSLPGGWLVVMPRVRVMTREEFDTWDYEAWAAREAADMPNEFLDVKPENFGWWRGRLVVLDYGS